MDPALAKLMQMADKDDGSMSELFQMMERLQSSDQASTPKVYSAELLPPFLTRMGYINVYNNETEKQRNSSVGVTIKHSVRPAIEHGPAPPLGELRPILLRDVARRVNHIHSGRVLFVTTTYSAYTTIGTSVLVEDDVGDTMMLSLYNYLPEDETEAERLPVGTHLAVLSPYMKNAKDDPSLTLMLRCDNPQCIIHFDTREQWTAAKAKRDTPPERCQPENLKQDGNEAFAERLYFSASRYYERALRHEGITAKDRISCLANLSEVALRRGQWELAETYASKVLAIDPDHVKAKYRLARARVPLGGASESLALATQLKASHPQENLFSNLVTDCERVLEEELGKYDLRSLRTEAKDGNRTTFHPDFVSARIALGIEIAYYSDGTVYRGCKALEDIPSPSCLLFQKHSRLRSRATAKIQPWRCSLA